MPEQLDFKKEYRNLYQPKAIPEIVDVPQMKFIMVDGRGNPNEENGEYARAVELLYGLSYTIKMSAKNGNTPEDFYEYVVPPLEGLWWTKEERSFDTDQKDKLIWTAMIRQPDFVSDEVFQWAVDTLRKKKPHLETDNARLEILTEGLCVQMMHLGPYDTEEVTVNAMDSFAMANGYSIAISRVRNDGSICRHHEIYLNDPRKVSPDKMKTVIRHPIMK